MPPVGTISISVATSSRLHFGLWAWGDDYERQFGGVGMMVCQPEIKVAFREHVAFQAVGPAAGRIQKTAERCAQHWRLASLPRCQIEATQLPPRHAGLGVGTQLALAVACGLAEWTNRSVFGAEALAEAAGRGLRSAVGTHGFEGGGLVVDAGKRRGDAVGRLHCRSSVPEDWRVVLVTPHSASGMAGEAEQEAFGRLPPVPRDVAKHLMRLALEEMVPACVGAEFDRFASALDDYGHAAGLCFKSVQGGPYATPEVDQIVDRLRSLGAMGVGQSSWGPTVFAFMPDETSATGLAERYRGMIERGTHAVVVTAAKNVGASVFLQSPTSNPEG